MEHVASNTASSIAKQPFLWKRVGLLVLVGILSVAALGVSSYIQYNSIQSAAPISLVSPVCGTWNTYLMPAAMPSADGFTSVYSLSGDDVWFVGPGSFAHWNGENISSLPGPDVKGSKITISDSVFTSDTDGWAVGSSTAKGENSQQSDLLILHWDGKEWKSSPIPALPNSSVGSQSRTNTRLNAISAISTDNIWAVGSYPQNTGVKTLILHWNGDTWGVITSPNIGTTQDNYLLSMAAKSENDIWAFGLTKLGYESWENRPLSMHWDGTSWIIKDSPKTLSDISAAAVSPNGNVWVVSLANNMVNPPSSGSALGSAVRGQNEEWHDISIPQIYEPALRAIVAKSSNDVWAAGSKGTAGLVIHWDGTVWSEVPEPNSLGLQHFFDIAAAGEDQIWVIGWSSSDEGSPVRQLMARFVECSSPRK